MRARLAEAGLDARGAHVEDNTFSVSVHYRNLLINQTAAAAARAAGDAATTDDAAAPPEALVAQVSAITDGVVAGLGGLTRREGKCVIEVRPDLPWHKGAAVLYLLRLLRDAAARAPGEGGEVARGGAAEGDGECAAAELDGIVPVYVGDDVADEDAFGALRPLGGVCVLVLRSSEAAAAVPARGGGVEERPRDTLATHALRNLCEVEAFLRVLSTV